MHSGQELLSICARFLEKWREQTYSFRVVWHRTQTDTGVLVEETQVASDPWLRNSANSPRTFARRGAHLRLWLV